VLDPLLRPFVDARDERDAELELNDLIEKHALPLATAIVTRKLRSFGTAGRDRTEFQDREDVVGDALTTLVARLRRAKEGGDDQAIENFESYTATVVYSACAHQIRRRHPERARLKNRLRYVFSTDRRLALWTVGELVCGLVEWRDRPGDRAAEQILRRKTDGDHRDWISLDRASLAVAIVDLVKACAGPIDFEALVAAVAAGVVEPRESAEASLLVPTAEPAQDRVIEQRRFLEVVWDEVGRLPVRQRIALLLNLRDASGAGILWLMPIAGVATIRQIARVLEIHDAEFAALWRDIPIDDAAIGRRLGCTRQQVINLRVSARKRLLNRVGQFFTTAGSRDRRRANLMTVSASLKDGT
jgi:DNA-directed RNA polymerase specialized sigma24 family protein